MLCMAGLLGSRQVAGGAKAMVRAGCLRRRSAGDDRDRGRGKTCHDGGHGLSFIFSIMREQRLSSI
jgi:hypothetical protein